VVIVQRLGPSGGAGTAKEVAPPRFSFVTLRNLPWQPPKTIRSNGATNQEFEDRIFREESLMNRA
jgi:hypothetical protein